MAGLDPAIHDEVVQPVSLERPETFAADIEFHDHAVAIWHSIQSDQQQREMALAAISSIPAKVNLSQLVKRVKWAKIKAAKLNEYRNLLAHNPIMFSAIQKKGKLQWRPSFGG